MPPRIALALSLLTLALAAPAAQAGTPGRWSRVTFPTGVNIDQVDLARAPDGVLHVAFIAKNAADQTKQDIWHAAITPAGAVSAPDAVQQGWASLSNPSIVIDGGGLRTFFGGIRTTNADETNSNLSTATAPLGGGGWALAPGNVATGDAAYASPSAATVAGGVPWQAWAGSAGVFVHRGLDPNTPNANLQTQLGGCCGYDPGIVTEPASGNPIVAWASNADTKPGVWVQALVAGSGAPIGSAVQMPGSTTGGQFSQQLARTPIAVRPGAQGAFVAYTGNYPTTTRVLLWRVGAPSSAVVASAPGEHRNVTLAAAPDGRIWVLWEQRAANGSPRVFARRSNPAVTQWGEPVAVAPPPKASDGWKLDADALTGRADVLGSFTTPDGLATWHTQILPGLTLTASKPQKRKNGRVAVKLRVLDAGAAVSGATVRVGGRSAKTSAGGRATFLLTRGNRRFLVITATKPGYASDSARVSLR